MTGYAGSTGFPQGPVNILLISCGQDVESDEEHFRNIFFFGKSGQNLQDAYGQILQGSKGILGETRKPLMLRWSQ